MRAAFELAGDFHEDIRGKIVRLRNAEPSEQYQHPDARKSYMEGFSPMQSGTVGDITAGRPLGPWTEALAQKLMAQNELIWDENGTHGPERERGRQEFADRYRQHIAAGDLYYPCADYPYIEWYSDNGRVVLELDPSQIEVLDGVPAKEKTPEELFEAERKRREAFGSFLAGMVRALSVQNRGDGGNAAGAAEQ